MKWVLFTKRTDDPKLSWLERQLDGCGIAHRRNGKSFHAPILEIDASRSKEAWDILYPVDDIPDDDPRFQSGEGLPDDEESGAYFDRFVAGDR